MSFLNGTTQKPFSIFDAGFANRSAYWIPGNGTILVWRNPVRQEPLASTGFKVSAYVVVILLSLVGNSLVIGSVYQNKNRRMRTVSNYLIVNLGVEDILITLCNMPRMISLELVGYEWLIDGAFGLLTCKINSSVPFISLFVSPLSFAFIALDRFLAVFFALRRPMTGKIMTGIITFTWILPCCCYYMLFHYAILVGINGKTYCGNSIVANLFKTTQNYHTYLICDFVIMSGVPIGTVTALYTAISVKLLARKTPGERTASGTARTRMINRKVISMLTTVVIVFCICWMHAWVAIGACLNASVPRFCSNSSFVFMRYFVSYSNSAITPYIYPVFNQNFRAAYLHILSQICCSCCCCEKICLRHNSNQEHGRERSIPMSRIEGRYLVSLETSGGSRR